MDSNVTGKVKLPPSMQVGIVVNDVEQVVEFYSAAFGIGPWNIRESEPEGKKGGQNFKFKTKVAFAQFGPIELELFEIREGKSPVHSVFLDQGIQGAHHFGFYVSREEKEQIIKGLAEIDIDVYQQGTVRGADYTFFDTVKNGGVFIEIVELPIGHTPPGLTPETESSVTGKVKLPPSMQVGLVVKDVDQVVDFYSTAFGIGPWRIKEGELEGKMGGQNYKFKFKVAFAQFGPVELELFAVTEGESPVHSVFLDKGREGIHHFGFIVSEEEIERMIKDLDEIGIGIFQDGVLTAGTYTFLDTEKIGGVFFELVAKRTE